MYKIKNALKKSKKVFIMLLILWVVLSIVFIAPIVVSSVEAKVDGGLNQEVFFNSLWDNFSNIKGNLGKIFRASYIGAYAKGELYLACGLLVAALVGILKSLPKNEYTDIEHGSSDWARDGEQYKVLSPKKRYYISRKKLFTSK